MDNWDPKPVFVEGKYISKDTWFDRDGKPFQPQVHYFVGGTKLYGAALYRLRPGDFGEIKHADGISPVWPLSYDDFEPWYSAAERLYQVHCNAGEDPTEGPRSEPYPWPAVSHEPRLRQISDDLAKGGYHPFHAPCGIMLDEARRPESTCIRCAKADAEVIAVRPLLGRPNVTLLTGAEVTRLADCAHQAGTCRFGTDPATSVLDVNCKAHELDNLYVVDTSFFPSIGAVNPALTAIANALRVAEHLRSPMA